LDRDIKENKPTTDILDLSIFPNLKIFDENHDYIIFDKIDVSKNPLLEELNLSFHRELKSLDVSKNVNLCRLNLLGVVLTQLDLSNTKIVENDYNNYNLVGDIWHKLTTELPKDKIIFAGQTKATWDEILDKIYNKFNGSDKPKNLNQVKEFVEKELKTLPKSGIEGDIKKIEAKKEDLLKLKKGSSNMSLSGGKGEIKDFST